MASLHERKNSPYFWIKFKDESGKVRFNSTQLSPKKAADVKQALILKEKLSSEERLRGLRATPDGWEWVEKALEPEFQTEATRKRTLDRWTRIQMFLNQFKITSPAHIKAETGADYLKWRTTTPRRSGKCASQNTARQELHLLKRIMRFAVNRRSVTYSPIQIMKLPKMPSKKKPEMTEEEIQIIRNALPNQPEWMSIAFEISLATGCRFRETQIPLKNINFKDGEITFPSPKGGPDKSFTVPMPTALRPLLESLKDREVTCKLPVMFSKEFNRDFLQRKLGLKHLCFHCLRVTRVSRLRRANVPREDAMRLVNHSDELVHKVYVRHTVQDLQKYKDAGAFPSMPESPKETPSHPSSKESRPPSPKPS